MPVKRRKTNPTATPTAGVTVDSADGTPAFSEAAHELAMALIETCLAGDLEGAAVLVGQGADAWVQDTEGWSALHAAARNDALVTLLLRKCNAVWNLVDNLGYTAGDIAYSLNDSTTYAILLAEGLRSELLRAVMEQLLPPSEEEEEDEGGELSTAGDNKTFLASKLRFLVDGSGQEICVDRENNGVMMGWERGLMERSARKLCEAFEGRREGREMEEELNVVNVGFGLGIIDGYLQEYAPTHHLILEPHPDVLASARAKGWYEKKGVHIFEGTWQAYLAALEAGTEEYLSFDAIYFDTYSEHYRDLHAFFDSLPNLLRSPSSRFSFFHGLGATSRFFYDVYTEVSEVHLREMGLTTEWSEVEVGAGAVGVWEGTERRYWSAEVGAYRLPICWMEM